MKPKKLTTVQSHLEECLKDPHFAESYAVEEFKAKIARELIKVRIHEKITQGKLAKKVGVSQQQISKIENGEFESMDTVIRVLIALKHKVTVTFPSSETIKHQHA